MVPKLDVGYGITIDEQFRVYRNGELLPQDLQKQFMDAYLELCVEENADRTCKSSIVTNKKVSDNEN